MMGMSCIEVGVSGRSFCRLTRTWPILFGRAFHRTKYLCPDWGYLLRFQLPLSVPSNPLIERM